MKQRPDQHTAPAGRATRGFTLLELVMASASMAVLMAASVALLNLVLTTMPKAVSGYAQNPDAVLDTLAHRLNSATIIEERNTSAIRFLIPDTNADLTDERFQYAWSGTPGDPLVLTRDGVGTRDVLDAVERFDIETTTVSMTEPIDGYETIGSTTDHAWGLIPITRLVSTSLVDNQAMVVIYPDLPADTVRWSIETITIALASGPNKNAIEVELFVTDTLTTNVGTPIASTLITQDDLNGDNTVDLDWVNLPEFEPGKYFVFTMQAQDHTGSSGNPWVWLAQDTTLNAKGYLRQRGGSGGFNETSAIIPHVRTFGRVTTPVAPSSTTTEHHDSVTITLRTPDSPRPAVRRVILNNAPEVN